METGLHTFCRSVVLALVLGAVAAPAFPEDVDASPGNYRARLSALGPGVTLRLAAGDYRDGLPVHGLMGTQQDPIRIVAADPLRRPRFLAGPGRNTVSIVDSAYVEIRGLEIDGQGVAVDGVKAEGHARWAHHITLEDLRITGHDADQQTVAISTKCPAWGWVIRGNEIAGAGTGLYLGNSDGSAPFFEGLIEGNIVRDTIGYNLQIKHQGVRPPNLGHGPVSALTIIRHNTFSKTGNSSGGKAARPNVLVGHQPPQGPGRDDVHVLYANLFLGNPGEALFQGEGNIALYSNVFVNPDGSAIVVQPHNGVPRSVEIVANTVLAREAGIRLRGADPSRSQRVEGNAVFAGLAMEGGPWPVNVVGPVSAARSHVKSLTVFPGTLDATPLPALRKASAMLSWRAPSFPDGQLDLTGVTRINRVAGAVDGFPRGP